MAKRSDFAQKLLDDLRLRKERMAASQNSKGTNQTVADAYAYSKRTYKSSREPKTLKTTGPKAGGIQNKPSGGSKSVTTGQVSNQIVPFGRAQKSEQIGDLSLALAFAIENGGKIRRTDSSGNSSMFSFLRNIGRRQMERRNSVVSRHQPSSSQLPTLSHLQIEEISRGAQKLNQILQACSNGLNFDRYSIEVGRELLKGAMDLEESLRMLVNMQEGSEYLITPQRKSRITLLEEDEDDDDENTVKIADQKQLDRPRFSFDRPSRNYNDIQEVARNDLKLRLAALSYSSEVTNSKHEKKVPAASNSPSHRRSVSYSPDIKTLSAFSEQSRSSSLQSKQEKSRIPNVIAKLMGLDELPGNVDSKVNTQESGKRKVEGMVTKRPVLESTKKAEQRTKDTANQVLQPVKQRAILASKIPLIQNTFTSQAGKTLTTRNGSTRVAVNDKLPPRKDVEDTKPVTSLRKATIKIDKQVDSAQLNHNSGTRREIQEKERKQEGIKQREQRGAERCDSKEPVFKEEMQRMILYMHKRSESASSLQERQEYSESLLHRENRYAINLLPSNQQKLQNNHEVQQIHMLQKAEVQDKKHQTEEKEQQSTKQKLQGKKQKGNEPISSNFSKPISGGPTNLQKKQPQMNQAETSKKASTEHIDATKFNGFADGRHHDNLARDRSSTNINIKTKDSIKRNPCQHYSRDLEPSSPKARILFAVDEKPVQVQTTMKTKSTKGHKLEVPRKINEVMTKIGGSAYNLPRTLKYQNSVLREGEQRKQERLAITRETGQMKDSGFEEVEPQIIRSNEAVEGLQPSTIAKELHQETQQNSILCSSAGDECQPPNESQALPPKDSCQNTVLMAAKEQQSQEPDPGRAEENEFKNCASDPLHGAQEESAEVSHVPESENQRTYTSEPLTESENHLKQILMKSQLFMNTAEALFKLDIPISILHASGHDYHNQESKLILDCGYEVMKRKGRRQELNIHPFLKVSITSNKAKSLDELVKQMCKDFDKLKLYGRDGREDSPFEDYLPKMLEADVYNKEPDVNCMWDLGWNGMMFTFLEKDEVIKDVEKYVLNGLLDEMARDLFTCISVSA